MIGIYFIDRKKAGCMLFKAELSKNKFLIAWHDELKNMFLYNIVVVNPTYLMKLIKAVMSLIYFKIFLFCSDFQHSNSKSLLTKNHQNLNRW